MRAQCCIAPSTVVSYSVLAYISALIILFIYFCVQDDKEGKQKKKLVTMRVYICVSSLRLS